jgi:citrate lyase subunit beta / citryl-CoA lyase
MVEADQFSAASSIEVFMSIKPRRSALYLPASNAKAIAKSRTLDCDVVILDLEDAVAPDAKQLAREQAIAAVNEGGFGSREVVIRVNGLDTEWGKMDLESVAAANPDAILVPKVNSAADVATYAGLLGDGKLPLWVMIETAISLFRLEEIAAMAARTSLGAFVIGTNDLAKEIGAQPDILRTPFVGALGLTVAAARAHGLAILDGVYNDMSDDDGFLVQARQAVTFGFDGKTLIHPRQVELCNRAFTPDKAAVDWARRIIAAFDAPENRAKGAIQIEGKMVERLHLAQALRTVSMAAA